MSVRVSVIIPALNEADVIGAVVRAVLREDVAECIVVDNGSTDGTAAVAVEAGARVIAAPRGYGAAMAAGVAAAVGEVLVFMDGDGADPVEDLNKISGPVMRGEADLVLASRLMGRREAGSMLGSQVMAGHLVGWAVRVLYGYRYTDMCAFRAVRKDVVERMRMREMTYGWNLEMQVKAVTMGLRIREVAVDYRRRAGGVSKVSGNWRASVQTALRIGEVLVRVRRGV